MKINISENKYILMSSFYCRFTVRICEGIIANAGITIVFYSIDSIIHSENEFVYR